MIPGDPVDDDIRSSWLMRVVIEDLCPDGTDDLINQRVPWRRPVTDVESHTESQSKIAAKSVVSVLFSSTALRCPVNRQRA
jgi:hypothetical protein